MACKHNTYVCACFFLASDAVSELNVYPWEKQSICALALIRPVGRSAMGGMPDTMSYLVNAVSGGGRISHNATKIAYAKGPSPI